LQGVVLDLGDQVAHLAGVVEQGLPGGQLLGAQPAGDGLAVDLAGPLGVGAVQDGRVVVAAAGRLAAGVGAHGQGGGPGGAGGGGVRGRAGPGAAASSAASWLRATGADGSMRHTVSDPEFPRQSTVTYCGLLPDNGERRWQSTAAARPTATWRGGSPRPAPRR